ncbi:MAG: hypothetical protein CM1200mP25_1280 [Acidobacteriota bacterium]|nr:MAG: hypothetical protein CM1200mP25_1280 [Acidobacteriota bacterium]
MEPVRLLRQELPAKLNTLTLQGRGEELGAAWFVTGTFQRNGQSFRVTARLTDLSIGATTESVVVDGTSDDIFVLQDQVVAGLLANGTPFESPAESFLGEMTLSKPNELGRGMVRPVRHRLCLSRLTNQYRCQTTLLYLCGTRPKSHGRYVARSIRRGIWYFARPTAGSAHANR